MPRRPDPPLPETLPLPSGGGAVALRRSARARRMVLSVSRADGLARLTLPPGATLAQAAAFLADRAVWLAHVQARHRPAGGAVEVGAALPVDGIARLVTPAPGRTCRLDGDRLLVPEGRPPGPVLAAWLRERARAALGLACARHALALPRGARAMTALSLRDTRSRWGSCTSDGRIMLSWRLAMAPPEVADYVAAHEVAHLRHMDHSAAFWATTRALVPDADAHRAWLKRHGPGLQAWRFRD